MDYTDSLYTTGQFAEMMNVNRRTLHYYSDIGLFRPAATTPSGYHLYSPFQALDFALIQTLRRMGLSIDEIRKYTEHPSGESFRTMLEERKEALEFSIRRLMQERNLLERKIAKLDLSEKARHGLIEEVYLPERWVLVSENMEKKGEKETLRILADFSRKLRSLMNYDNFGTRIRLSNACGAEWDSYDSFFAYTDEWVPGAIGVEGGHWLRAFSVGPWNRIGEVYAKMMKYAKERKLEPVGYAYEEGLSEMNLDPCEKDGKKELSKLEMNEDYVTMLLIKVV